MQPMHAHRRQLKLFALTASCSAAICLSDIHRTRVILTYEGSIHHMAVNYGVLGVHICTVCWSYYHSRMSRPRVRIWQVATAGMGFFAIQLGVCFVADGCGVSVVWNGLLGLLAIEAVVTKRFATATFWGGIVPPAVAANAVYLWQDVVQGDYLGPLAHASAILMGAGTGLLMSPTAHAEEEGTCNTPAAGTELLQTRALFLSSDPSGCPPRTRFWGTCLNLLLVGSLMLAQGSGS